MSPIAPWPIDRIASRIIGARVVHVEELHGGFVLLAFEHRGTDLNAGHLVVIPGQIEFADDGGEQ